MLWSQSGELVPEIRVVSVSKEHYPGVAEFQNVVHIYMHMEKFI
jgi:hypothetical protein